MQVKGHASWWADEFEMFVMVKWFNMSKWFKPMSLLHDDENVSGHTECYKVYIIWLTEPLLCVRREQLAL